MPRAQCNGVELEYEVMGSGEPLLLVMGLGAQLVQWPDGFCERLVERGYMVIRFDNRDIGLSSWLDHLGVPNVRSVVVRGYAGLPVSSAYTLSDMSDDAVALMDALGLDDAHVVGASMGGMIAQTMAIERPSRVRSLVSIMSSPGNRRYSIAKPHALKALLEPPAKGREAQIESMVEKFRVFNGAKLPFNEAVAREIMTRAYDRGFHPAGFARQLNAIIASGARREQLRAVRCPTTVIHGTDDALVPPGGGAATARAIPNARLQWVDGMGHSLPVVCWGIIVDAIDDNCRRVVSP